MNRKMTAAVVMLFCIYLDTILFAMVNVRDVRPDAMLAATISFAVLSGNVFGAVFGMLGGLLIDIFSGRYVGLYAALYLIAGMAGGFFYKKFYADNIIVPALAAAATCFMKDIVLAFVAFMSGARFGFAVILLRYILPGAMITGALCALMHLALRPLLERQVKRGQAERIGSDGN